jgi:hypothetical protein
MCEAAWPYKSLRRIFIQHGPEELLAMCGVFKRNPKEGFPMIRPTFRTAIGIAALMAGLTGPAMSQDKAAATGDDSTCAQALSQAEPATIPDASEDGTAAENSGTTGWSGGTGGSQLGTNSQGAVSASPTWQPPTARGLDLQGQPEPVADC